MKILLVTEPINLKSIDAKKAFLFEPLGLEYLGAGVQEEHDVKLVDLRIDPAPDLNEILETFRPDVIGCGGCTMDVYNIKQLFARAKERLPGVLTVVGGHHASVVPQDFFDRNIDVVVIGEGCLIFKKICQCYERQKSFEEIENIYFRNCKNGATDTNGKMVFTRKAPYPDLGTLPFPARSLTSGIRDRYLWPRKKEKTPFASMLGSAGCIYRCKFCAITTVMDGKVYPRNIDGILEELTSIDESYISWVDDEFLLDPQRAVQLAKAIGQAGLRKFYYFQGRSDNIVKYPECIEAWAKIGLKYAFIGMESHREKYLKLMGKGTSTSINEEAIRICHANNVQVRGAFIVHPDFDEEDFKKMGEYVRDTGVDLPSFTVLTPFPGTKLYEEEENNLLTDDYHYFDTIHTVLPTKLPLKKFYKSFINLHAGYFSLKKIISFYRTTNPALRRHSLKLVKKIKNCYRDYDKHLW